MPKPRRKLIPLRKPIDPEMLRQRRRTAAHCLAATVLLAACCFGFYLLRGYVDHTLVLVAHPPKVVLKNCPRWMSPLLAERIAAVARPNSAYSAFNHQVLVDTVALLRSDPWIRSVNQVRRVYEHAPGDAIEIDCDYRT